MKHEINPKETSRAHAGKFLSNLQEEINRLCKNKLGL